MEQQSKSEINYTPDGKAVAQVKFKGSNNYELSLKEHQGQVQLLLSCKQNMFNQWVTEINLDEELSKQPDLRELCEGLSLSEFQQGLIDFIQNEQYQIDVQEDESVILSFFDTIVIKKMKRETEIKKNFQFQLKKEDLIKADESNQGFIKIANQLQDRVISVENENFELRDQLDHILNHLGISIEEMREFKNNPLCFSGISKLIDKPELLTTIQKWLPKMFQQKKAKLLFRASRDGYNSKQFHDKTDNKGPLLFVLKDNKGKLYGGFCPDANPFSTINQWKQTIFLDQKNGPFIFCLNDKIKCPLTKGKQQYTYYSHQSYGPAMGGSHDIYIFGNENKNFQLQVGYSYDNNGMPTLQNQTYSDYEVFGF